MKDSRLSTNNLFTRVSLIIESARGKIARAVNSEMVSAYWLIGKEIIDEEQKGRLRAEYGAKIIEKLSQDLTVKYGAGWSASHLWHVRQFYVLYKDRLPENLHTLRADSEKKILHTLRAELSWSHYRILMRVEKPQARSFYEVECLKNNWSARELERQKGSLLFERLTLSKDRKSLMKLAKKGQEIRSYEDMIKDPYILEFTGLSPQSKLYESKLEQALIDNLSKFLLELGKGFTFSARQKRISLDGDHFYIDLVFYNTILKCYIIVDLKIGKLVHQDIGQMQMYVNFYDRKIKQKDDNPTVGLVLCEDKKVAVVRYTLSKENKQIFASRYKLYLPTEEELVRELRRERALIELSAKKQTKPRKDLGMRVKKVKGRKKGK
ncbi:MAG: PDDEXK nuclease domain-containing protein [Candidatus Omnitrophota bacterium]